MARGLDITFGTAAFGNPEWAVPMSQDDGILEAFSILKKHNIHRLDTAHLYGNSEATLGRLRAGTDHGLIIDTKWLGGWAEPGTMNRERIISSAQESLSKLGVPKVDIFYIHAPTTDPPFEEQLAAVNEVYQSGIFARFGLSNFTPAQVQQVHDICKANNYVLPSVYQGNYSAVARKQEDDLFPLLRKFKIAFYAYSPVAGGFLTKSRASVEAGEGRFNKEALGGMYQTLYSRPSFLKALDDWESIAQDEGISRAALAYRWVTYNSPLKSEYGDNIIVGASRPEQLEQTIEALEAGPLSDKAAKRIDAIWDLIKDDALVDNFDTVIGGQAA